MSISIIPKRASQMPQQNYSTNAVYNYTHFESVIELETGERVNVESNNHTYDKHEFVLPTNCNNEKVLPHIFKLDVSSFNRIFDWLSQSDIIAIGESCKRFQQIAGEYFQSNYWAKCARGENDGVYLLSKNSNIFSRYIRKVSISGDRLGAYRFIGENCTNFLTQMRFYGTIPIGGFEYIKEILAGVEVLEMNECLIDGEFYENYLKYCSNLKSLSVSRSNRIRDRTIVIGCDNNWLLRSYPTLVNFELIDWYGLKNNEITTFFQQNQNVRTLSTDVRSLWENRHSHLASSTKLDKLAVDICQSKIIDSNNQPISLLDSVYHLLHELHECGFYMRLNLYVYFVDKSDIQKMFSLNGLEMICGDIIQFGEKMIDLKMLGVCYGNEIWNIEELPVNLTNLERVYFAQISIERILLLICECAKLKQIKIKRLTDGKKMKWVDLMSLNEQRSKLSGAEKLTIYLKEDLYLETKWMKNCIDFSFIEFKRFESFEWEELNAKFRYYKSM